MALNLPNKITLARIFLIPFIMFFYIESFFPYGKLIALILFILAATTDFLDGYIARKNNLVTNLGKFLDPIADKILAFTGLFLIICITIESTSSFQSASSFSGLVLAPYGAIFGIILVSREFLVSALRQIAASKNVVIAADKIGKYKTMAQYIALSLYFLIAVFIELETFSKEVTDILLYIAFSLLAVSVLLCIVSGVNYFIKNGHALKEKGSAE